MKNRFLLLIISSILILTACGQNGSGDAENEIINEVKELNLDSSFKRSNKTVTIYVHGYKKGGYKFKNHYGENNMSSFAYQLSEFSKIPTMDTYNRDSFTDIITSVEYYGEKEPSYYTPQDVTDINEVTDQYSGGVPRYALIVAKFAKHMMKETGAKKVNIVSVSMGSLITRWMIEKNLENLASEKKIEKWMTAEGVVRGNYGVTKIDNIGIKWIKDYIESFFEDSAETEHMKYSWIEDNLTPDREVMSSPYYGDILVGQISLTDSEKQQAGLKYILIEEGFQPNDGYQLLKDTYFKTIEYSIQTPSHTLIHTDHIGIEESNATYATITAFLEAKKRVRITLTDVTVSDVHESISPVNKHSEIVFSSSVYSSKAGETINQRVYDGGTLNVYSFKENETKSINQVIFDDFVYSDEDELRIKLKGYEIDRSTKYDVVELQTDKKDSLGEVIKGVELRDGASFSFSAGDWVGVLEVRVLGL